MLDPLLQDKEDVFGVINIVATLLPSPALLLFVTRGDLFAAFDTVHLVLLLPGIGLGVVTACAFASINLIDATNDRAIRVRQRDGKPEVPPKKLQEWGFLSNSSGFANMFLLLLTAWGYWHRLRLGASLVALVVGIIAASFVARGIMALWPIDWTNPPRGQRAPE